MKVTAHYAQNKSLGNVTLLCPHCHHKGVFTALGNDIEVGDGWIVSHRRCPNTDCHGLVYIGCEDEILKFSYPPIRVDFNTENVPEKIRNTFEEALDCHASGSYIASAIMVRRTLEEICHDREAVGNNLKKRISSLQSKIVLPPELLDGLDELRLLGNDAAHVEAQDYQNIASDELDVAIEFTKEILKGLYQYSALLKKIRALKKKSTDE